jgi:lysophospholipase-2
MNLLQRTPILRRSLLSSAFLLLCNRPFTPVRSFSASSSYNMPPYSVTRSGTTITVSPKIESDQTGLVVIMHGLGDSAEGFADVAEQIASQMPHLKIILPTAPTQPVTMNMGMPMPSWYDLTGLDERSNERCKGIAESRQTVVDILDAEHQSTKLPYDRMMLMGFSQGGAMSLFTGMQLPKEKKLGGIVVMSGYLPARAQFALTPGLEETPILHCHGEADPMVQIGMARRSHEVVKNELGASQYELKTYAGLVHTVSMDELQDVQNFIQKILPAPDVPMKDPSEMSVKELRAAIRRAGIGQKAVGLMEKPEFVKLLKDHRDGKL